MTGTFCALLLFLNAAIFAVPAAAEGGDRIVVTSVQRTSTDNRAEITLNGCLVIRDIEVSRIGDRMQVRFPEYVSRKKRVYPQVVLLTRQARDAVRQALESGRPGTGQAAVTGYAVTRFSPFRKRSNLKVLAAVSFNNAVEVECRVLEGRNGPWIAWPERRTKERGKRFRQVLITDKRLKESVEQELLDRYASLTTEEGAPEHE